MRTWIEISQKNIKNNYDVFRKLAGPNCLLMAVVKSNAYGHNLIDFSLAIESMGIDWLGVDSIIEAETLRDIGIKKPILVLGYTIEDKIEIADKNNISLTISDFFTLKNLKKHNSKKKIKIHLKIDTGMHRQGFFINEIPKVMEIIKKEKLPVILEGAYTHFASAKNPSFPKETLNQLDVFKKSLKIIESFGFTNLIKHASSTSGSIIFPETHFDMIRVGIGMYGLWPSKETKASFSDKIHLRPVLSWKTIVGQIKNLPKGSRIGYDLTETITRNSKVAILPFGYWHGFPRSLSSIGEVIIRGKKARVLGRISMDMISVDVTDIRNLKIGDKATIIGKEKESEITADDLAYLTDTTCYEIVTRINPRIKRFLI